MTCIGALSREDSKTFQQFYSLVQAFEAGAMILLFTDRGLGVFEIPRLIHTDARNRLHCESGPAIDWLADFCEHHWHGVRVPAYVVENPRAISVADIQSEANTEVRRVKLERYGTARYLADAGARPVHQDDFGVLYRIELPEDEPLVMVKVVNSTPEPDGSFKDYFLRVPPDMERAKQAVAWTFNKSEEEYLLQAQT